MSVPRAGSIPRLLNRRDVYAAERPGRLSPIVRHDPARVYVPNSESNTVDVHLAADGSRSSATSPSGALPQHVTPSWDLKTLWVTNDEGNSPDADRPADRAGRGARSPVADPYNLYFTADGRRAIVVAERSGASTSATPHTMRLRHALSVPQCAGVDHMDFTADGRRALVSCEFAGRMIVVDLAREKVDQDDRAARRARCPRTSSSRPTGARSTSPTWRPTASG